MPKHSVKNRYHANLNLRPALSRGLVEVEEEAAWAYEDEDQEMEAVTQEQARSRP